LTIETNNPIMHILKRIAALNSFRELNLENTSCTDDDVAQLAGMTTLRKLVVNPKTTTSGGRDRLRKALPTTAVEPY
jgi:hypothetical protein